MDEKMLFPNEKIIVTKLFDVHQDWEIPIPGFFIIASIRKIKSIGEFNDEEVNEFINLLREIRKGMKEKLGINEVYLFQNEATSHKLFHLWILPRYPWMDKFGYKIESIRPIIEYSKKNMKNEKVFLEVKEYAKKMREHMSSYNVSNKIYP